MRPAWFFRALPIAAILVIGSCGSAVAQQIVKLRASFSPERLGTPTTISIAFRISSVPAGDSLPLTNVSVLLPDEMGLATSGLGLENCALSRLEAFGPSGCPANALMGRGTASAEIPIGGEDIVESAQVELFSSHVQNGRLALMVYVDAKSPVFAQLVFPATVVPASLPYGEGIDTEVPLVPTVPGGPNVAVTHFKMMIGTTTAGPDHFVYFRSAHRRRVPYHPRGLLLPPACPRGGFPFQALFTFEDGSTATARTTVPCPRHTRH